MTDDHPASPSSPTGAPPSGDPLDGRDGLVAYLPDFTWAPIAGTELEGRLDTDGQRSRLVYRRRQRPRRRLAAGDARASETSAAGISANEADAGGEVESEEAEQRRLALERFAVLDACLSAVEHRDVTTDLIVESEDTDTAAARLAEVLGVQPRWARAVLNLNFSVLTRRRTQQLRDDLAELRAHLEGLGEQLPSPDMPEHPVVIAATEGGEQDPAPRPRRAGRDARVVGARWWRWLRSAPLRPPSSTARGRRQ